MLVTLETEEAGPLVGWKLSFNVLSDKKKKKEKEQISSSDTSGLFTSADVLHECV